jgi:hypothetical protein
VYRYYSTVWRYCFGGTEGVGVKNPSVNVFARKHKGFRALNLGFFIKRSDEEPG